MTDSEILDKIFSTSRYQEVRDLIDVAKNLYINKSRKDYNKVKKEVEKILKKREEAEQKRLDYDRVTIKSYPGVFESSEMMLNTLYAEGDINLENELIEHFQDYKDGIQLKKAQLRQRAAEIRERKEKRDAKRNRTVLAFLFVLLLIIIIISTTIRILND